MSKHRRQSPIMKAALTLTWICRRCSTSRPAYKGHRGSGWCEGGWTTFGKPTTGMNFILCSTCEADLFRWLTS